MLMNLINLSICTICWHVEQTIHKKARQDILQSWEPRSFYRQIVGHTLPQGKFLGTVLTPGAGDAKASHQILYTRIKAVRYMGF